MSEPAAAPARPGGALRRLAELVTLTAFAIVQPVLDVTGRSPDFFVYRQATAADMTLLLLLVVLAPPLLLWVAERAVGMVNATAERALHLVFVAGLFAVVAIEVGKQVGPLTGKPLAALAALAGVGLAVLVARSAKLRQVLLYAVPAPLLFALLFVTTTPSGDLIRPAKQAGAAKTTAQGKPPVVVVFFDEFPTRTLLDDKGRIDARLYPNFARLAAASTWYPNATGVSGQTPYAIPAMLTGRYPYKVAAPHYSQFPDNLFTMLGGAYDVRAFESIAQLCPPRLCDQVPTGRATGLRPLIKDTAGIAREIVSPNQARAREGEEFAEAGGSDIPDPKDTAFGLGAGRQNQPDRFTNFVDGLEPLPEPTLHYLHLLLPHTPFRWLPSGRRYVEPPSKFALGRNDPADNGRRNASPGVAEVMKQRLLLQAAYTDGLIGQLIDQMKSTGLWDDALVVITADHGAGLAAGVRSRFLDDTNQPDLSWVPLFVKTPKQAKGAVDTRNEQHVDLIPTIADAAGVEVTWQVDGQSLLGPPRATAEKKWFDSPGRAKTIDVARWQATARTGVAGSARPADGAAGLYAVGPHKALVGKPVSGLDVGPATGMGARLDPALKPDAVKLDGIVPALLWGGLDGAPAPGETWLVAAVNGTVAGSVVAVPVGDGWHFMGLVNDERFRDGANDVVLYTVDGGGTLHPVPWRT